MPYCMLSLTSNKVHKEYIHSNLHKQSPNDLLLLKNRKKNLLYNSDKFFISVAISNYFFQPFDHS